jgi:cysteine desulfurase/selenocysteine lyase
MTATVPPLPTLDEIQSELQDCETASERLEFLVELGATLPVFPVENCIEANRVLGCQSMVWLVHRIEGTKLSFEATSDAPMVRGLIAILLAAYSGRSAEEILEQDIESYFERIKLKSFITPMRSNGLHSMVLRVRAIAHETLTKANAKNIENPRSVRSTVPATRRIEDAVQDFPILNRILPNGKRLIYLDNAASSQRPRQVIQAMSRVYEEHYANVHRSGHELAAETTTKMELARQSLSRFINSPGPEQVIFTSGTTAGINLVARSWGDANLSAGDEIILSEMEHHSNIVPWQQLAARTGATIRWIPITQDYTLDLDAFDRLLSPGVKLVAVTAVSNVLGTINPVAEIVQKAKSHGAVVLIDAAQAIPHGGVDVQAWDADFVVFSGHKMLGPTGIGVLYGRRELLDRMPPFLGGGNMIHSVTKDGFVPAGIPHRFEAGTAPIVEAIAMHEAVQYIESLGEAGILEHEQRLAVKLQERLTDLPRLKFFGPSAERKVGIFTFTIDDLHADEIGRRLDAEGIAIRVGHHCAMPLHQRLGLAATCRASIYFYNTDDEVEFFCDRIQKSAVTRKNI